MKIYDNGKPTYEDWHNSTKEILYSADRDKDDWDFKDIHFCIDAYQSCQDAGMACGIRLSTWAARDLPWKQSGNQYGTAPHPEKDLGYSFEVAPVSCLKCIEWMQNRFKRCSDCDKLSQLCSETIKYCGSCSEKRDYKNLDK